MTRRQTGNMDPDNQAPDGRFYYLGRMIAVLELDARAHGEIRLVHLYYALGFMPWAGLREPLEEHRQSALPCLEREERGEAYR